jgi:hypothetical protein
VDVAILHSVLIVDPKDILLYEDDKFLTLRNGTAIIFDFHFDVILKKEIII